MAESVAFRPVPTPLKTHGGKSYLAKWILSLMPRHLHYVEPYAGGLSVLLARDPDDPRLWLADTSSKRGVSELANDIDGRLMNFWDVLKDERDGGLFARFVRQVQAIPPGRAAWERAYDHVYGTDPVADAVAFFVCCRQSLAGRMKGFTSITRNRTRRRMNGNVSEWLSAVDGLPDVHERLRRVMLECGPALKVIRREDTPHTLFYCDPPYLTSTRTAREVYAHEMTEADHRELLDVLRRCKGMVMLSGYESALYDRELASWDRHTKPIANHSSGAKTKPRKVEVLWCNFTTTTTAVTPDGPPPAEPDTGDV
jgi:DNA adenine methylase